MNKEMNNCESIVMKIVWDSKEDISTSEIIEQLKVKYNKNYARTTVVTFIQRLIEKGYVTRYKKGRASFIHPIKDLTQHQQKIVQEIDDLWFDGNAESFFSELCNVRKLTKEEVNDIRRALDELDN